MREEKHRHEHGHDHDHDHEKEHGCCGFEELTVLQDEIPALEPDVRPGEERSVFVVDGMDCGECARTVERVVSKLDGVRDVSVSFSTTKMQVIHTKEIDSILRAVEQVGYRVRLQETTADRQVEAPRERSRWEQHKRTILTAVSGLFWGVGMVGEFAGWSSALLIALFLTAMVSGGFHAARAAFYALRSRSLDMNFLMTVAAAGAAAIGEWSEGATVVFLFAVGNWLQAMTMERTRRSIRSLMDLAPKEALVRRGGAEKTLPLSDLRLGDVVIVRPGERLPMDGLVVSGASTVNQAPITGESIPVAKRAGDDVFAGTINETGTLEFRVTKRVEDTTLSRIIHLVEEAQAQKAPSEQFVDVFAKYYTPLVVVLAVLIALLPPLFTGDPLGDWVYRALALLVIACPCALVISTPVSIVAAIGNAAKQGVLIKGGAFLERMGSLEAIAFDKTGTLTQGKPHVVHLQAGNGGTEDGLLEIAAAIESRSEHPLARAVTERFKRTGRDVPQVEQFEAVAGNGAAGVVGGVRYRIGKPKWFDMLSYETGEWKQEVEAQQELARTVMLVGDEARIIGMVAVADVVRPESAGTIRALKSAGVRWAVMLTGDNEHTAAAIRVQVGIDEAQGELLPEAKLERIRELKSRFRGVAMVGDGINDAPALATADIGIAMGGAGTDTALETADIVLMADDLGKLPFTLRLSRQALRIIKQNVWFSLAVKLVFLVLTVLGLSNLWMAVFADTGAALLVIANGMRLLRSR